MTIVPRSWARASASGSGSMPLEVTIAAQPSSTACSCASARSPTTTMSPASMLRPIVATSIEMTHSRPVIIVSPFAGDELALQHLDDRVDARGGVGEGRDAAGLAHVQAREVALGDHPGQLALVVDDGHEVHPVLGHLAADLPDRVGAVGDDLELLHDVRHPQADVGEELGLLRAAALERPRGLPVDVAEADRRVRVVGVQPPHELGEADRGADRVEVRVAVSGHVDVGHVGRCIRMP